MWFFTPSDQQNKCDIEPLYHLASEKSLLNATPETFSSCRKATVFSKFFHDEKLQSITRETCAQLIPQGDCINMCFSHPM